MKIFNLTSVIATAAAFLLSSPTVSATKRYAYVKVRNNTNKPMLAVGVVHKYSDNYKQHHEWPIIQPGELSSDQMTVTYNTGFLTTGKDWWYISWYSEDMETLYYSDPNNLRSVVDALENIAPDVISKAAEAAAGLVTAPESGPGAVVAAKAASAAAAATTKYMFNSESTAGFKQHILREDDQIKRVTEIIINADHSITFKSHSGTSKTVSSHKPVPHEPVPVLAGDEDWAESESFVEMNQSDIVGNAGSPCFDDCGSWYDDCLQLLPEVNCNDGIVTCNGQCDYLLEQY